MDRKKLFAIGIAGLITPTIGVWANNCVAGSCDAFTLGNVLAPAIPTLLSTVTTLIAFFMQPKKG